MLLVPGCHFFTACAPLPAGTAERELPGLAALALEADSPFADAQPARRARAARQLLVGEASTGLGRHRTPSGQFPLGRPARHGPPRLA